MVHRSGRVEIALLGALLAVAGCLAAAGGWDVGSLRTRHPVLAAFDGERLGDLAPHFAPDEAGAALFLCRWSTDAPIPVSLPPDATSIERAMLRMALMAWRNAGLGVAFQETSPSQARLEIRFADAERDGWAPQGTGDTVTDCAISHDFAGPSPEDRVLANMSLASVYLRRSNLDTLGRARPLEPAVLLGAALHELGHALGFTGHVRGEASVMSVSTEAVARVGRRIAEGEGLEEPTLAALYALPVGVRVGRVVLSEGERRLLQRASAMASSEGWSGPFVRIGGGEARLLWRAEGRVVGVLRLARWPGVVRGRVPFEAEPRLALRTLDRAVAAEP